MVGLKILHTGDLHIGMKFNSYPELIRDQLIKARFNVLQTLVNKANNEQCNILAVAGDLFDKITVPKKDIEKALSILEGFAGDCILILPGNHDYDNGMVELWDFFKKKHSDKVILINENRVYSLESHDLDVAIYPAGCNRKHSKQNNLGWIKEISKQPEAKWHIGLAHGALEGVSPDMSQQYFFMTTRELEELPIDIWLLGHTHAPYPAQSSVTGNKIFNAGSPEPDGMDCTHSGHAWLLEIDEKKNVTAELINSGTYRFIDTTAMIEDGSSFESIKRRCLKDGADTTLLRLKLKGRIDQDLFRQKESFYKELESKLAYLKIDDTELGVKITGDIIDSEFTSGSFPHQFLNELFSDGDEDALQIAYELIQGVKAI